jgi:hypothetical protein
VVTFVHIADERDTSAIRRSGLSLPKARLQLEETETRKFGVFALPVVQDFVLSHQWARELARSGHRSAVGVYFRVPDKQLVWAGLYNGLKHLCTAASAAAQLHERRILGYEVIVPRSIKASEITAVRVVPAVGWRYYPPAKGKRPFCPCKFCTRGDSKSRRLRERLDPNREYA